MSILHIHVVTAHPKDFPYDTSGYWAWEGDTLCVAITPQQTQEASFLLAMHEVVEAFLCKQADIPDDIVTEFDKEYESRRKRGDNSEPGDHAKSPYRKQHQAAERIERLLCREMHIDFSDYIKELK